MPDQYGGVEVDEPKPPVATDQFGGVAVEEPPAQQSIARTGGLPVPPPIGTMFTPETTPIKQLSTQKDVFGAPQTDVYYNLPPTGVGGGAYRAHREVGARPWTSQELADLRGFTQKIGGPEAVQNPIGAALQTSPAEYANLALAGFGELAPGAALAAKNKALARTLMGASTAVNAYFTYQMAHGAGEETQKAYDAYKRGDYAEMAYRLGDAGVNALLAGVGIRNLAKYGVIGAHAGPAEPAPPSEPEVLRGGTIGPEPPRPAPAEQPPIDVKAAPEQPVPPPEPPKPTPVERVSPATPNPPTAARPTVPETPQTYALQTQQLAEGTRKVVMLPKGEAWRPETYPPNTAITDDGFGNIFIYRTDLTTKSKIREASRNNKLPEILGGPMGMGAPDKSELPPNPPVVVVRGPDGTEVQSTATSPEVLPITVAAHQPLVPPGGNIEVQNAPQALEQRTEPEPPPAEPEPAATPQAGKELFRGGWDLPLNQHGLDEATDAARRTAGQFDVVYHSPLLRARQTAAEIASTNPQAKAIQTDALEPWILGQHEGQEVTQDRIADLNDRIANRPDEPIPGAGTYSGRPGESFNQFKDPLIEHVIGQLRSYQPGQRILNVTHYRDLRAIDAWLKAGAKSDMSIDIADMTKKGPEQPGQMFTLESGGLKEVNNADAPGIYFLRHGETDANEGAQGNALKSAPETPSKQPVSFNAPRLPQQPVSEAPQVALTKPVTPQVPSGPLGTTPLGARPTTQVVKPSTQIETPPPIGGKIETAPPPVETKPPALETPPAIGETKEPERETQQAEIPQPSGALRREPLAQQLPEEARPTEAGRAPGVGGGRRGTPGSPRHGAVGGEGPRLGPSERVGDPGVGSPASAEQNFPNFPERTGDISDPDLGHDYRIPDERVISGSPEKRARDNVAAIKLLRQIEKENRPATVDEKPVLAGYVGWGAVPQIFAAPTPEWKQAQDELKALISPEEYAEASRSTTNAHYTNDATVDAIWAAMQHLGAKPGMSWLEPAVGVGNFLGRQPAELLQGAKRVGIDKDALTSGIAKLLYPDSGIEHTPFEKSELPDNYFDAAISNVPFGDFGVHDPAWKTKPYLTNPIHNYFFAKSLGYVRPGGVIGFVTSRYTMDGYDKGHRAFREYMASKADFLGAVRLPTNAFQQSSGTHVITDIIFLRKRAEGAEPAGRPWVEVASKRLEPASSNRAGWPTPIPVNEYYHLHPESVLGEENLGRGQFSANDYNVQGTVTKESLTEALKRALPRGSFQEFVGEKKSKRLALRDLSTTDEAKKIGGLFFDDNGALFRKTSAGSAEPMDATGPTKERIRGQLGIRDGLQKLIAMEQGDEAGIEKQRTALNSLYDAYISKYGPLSNRTNQLALVGDPDAPLLTALETRYDEKAKTAEKAPILSKRIFRPIEKVTSAADAKEALYVALNETGRIDWPRMQELTGRSPAEMQGELSGIIFEDPKTHVWQTAEEYLSGAVRSKLKDARKMSKVETRFAENVRALEDVQPEDIPPSQISALPGVTWVPAEFYGQFIKDVLNSEQAPKVHYVAGEWHFERPYSRSASRWSTAKADAYTLVKDAMNLRRTKIYTQDENGQPVLDKQGTLAAREKQKEIAAYFEKWLFSDAGRADEVTRIYNDQVNDLRLRTYDGSHLTLPEMSRGVLRSGDLEPYQKAAVWRQIAQKNVLLAHAVGSGKTFEMITGGMELKRLGLIKRPMYVVPNATLSSWQSQFAALYPQKRVLVFSEKDLEKQNRRRIFAQIATGEWDAVVVPHSSFGFIPVGDEIFEAHYQRLADELEDSIRAASEAGADTRLVKRMEKAKEKLLTQMQKRRNETKQDQTATWEQMGIDQLFVDEAHEFKKLGFSTKQQNVPGIDPAGNQKTFDLRMKSDWTQKHGRGVVFASGTPVTNTMGELYNVMQYLIQSDLDARGIGRFDEWSASFGRTKDIFEPKPEGGGYQMKTRYAEFVNLPELSQLFRSFADVLTPDMLDIPRPKIAGGQRRAVMNQLNEAQQEIMKGMQDRAKSIRSDPRNALPDNMAALYTDAQKMALDARMMDPSAPDYDDNRLTQAANEISRLYKESAGVKGTQLVFADFGKPLEFGGMGDFSAYDDLIQKLKDRGIPSNEIAHIYEAKNKAQRTKLFQDVNDGKIRVLLGSTGKMGTGVNVQERVYALHHLTLPHRPSDLEQREGRAIRQGNINPEVHLIYYGTNGSLDELKFANVSRKSKAFNQFMQGGSTLRKMEDVDDMAPSLDEFQAQASGDPRVRRKLEVDNELLRLSALNSAWRDARWKQRQALNEIPRTTAFANKQIAALQSDIRTRDAAGRVFKIDGKTMQGEGLQKDAAEAIASRLAQIPAGQRDVIGTAYGLPIEGDDHHLYIGKSHAHVPVTLNDDKTVNGTGTFTKIENAVKGLANQITTHEHVLAKAERDRVELGKALDEPWANQKEYGDLIAEQARLFKELGGSKDEAGLEGEEVSGANVEASDETDEEEPLANLGPEAGVGNILLAPYQAVNEFIRQDVAPKTAAVVEGFHKVVDDVRRIIAPQTRGDLATVAAGTVREMSGKLARQEAIAKAALEAFRDNFQKRPAEFGVHGMDIIDAIEAGATQGLDPKAESFADIGHEAFDDRWEKLNDRGLLETYIENYITHAYKNGGQLAQQFASQWMTRRPLVGPESFRHKRTFPTFREALEWTGPNGEKLEPKFDNPVDYVLYGLSQMDRSIYGHDVFNEWKGNGYLKYVTDGKLPAGYNWIDDKIFRVMGPRKGAVTIDPNKQTPKPELRDFPDRKSWLKAMQDWRDENVTPEDVTVHGRREMGRYAAPDQLAQVANNYLSQGYEGKKLYDAYMAVKGGWNALNLGFSAFHGSTTALNSSFADMANGLAEVSSGKITKGAKSIARGFVPGVSAIQDYRFGKYLERVYRGQESNPDPMAVAVMEALERAGYNPNPAWDPDMLYKGLKKAWEEGNPVGAAVRIINPLLWAERFPINRFIMQKLVPRAKLGALAKAIQVEIQRNPGMGIQEARERFGKLSDSIDNAFGQLNTRNMLMKNTMRGWINIVVGRPGWNIGSLRGIFGGSGDIVSYLLDKAKGEDPEMSHRARLLLAWIFGGALMGGLVTAILTQSVPDSFMDFIQPRDGGHTEDGKPTRIVLPTYLGKDIYSYVTRPIDTMIAKLSQPLMTAGQLAKNRTWRNEKILGPGGVGVGGYAKELVQPYMLGGLERNIERGQNIGRTAAPMLGIMPASRYASMSPAEKIIAEWNDEHRGVRPPSTMHMRERAKVFAAARSGDLQKAKDIGQNAVRDGNLTPADVQASIQRAKVSPLVADFKRVSDIDTAMRAYDAATEDEKKKLKPDMRAKLANARQKPYEWNNDTRRLAQQYFKLQPNTRLATPPAIQ